MALLFIYLHGYQIFIDRVEFSNNKLIYDTNYATGNLDPLIDISSPSEKEGSSVIIKESKFDDQTTRFNSRTPTLRITQRSYSSLTEISKCTFTNSTNYDVYIHLWEEGYISISQCSTDKSKSLELHLSMYTESSLFETIKKAIQEGYFKTDNTLPLCF